MNIVIMKLENVTAIYTMKGISVKNVSLILLGIQIVNLVIVLQVVHIHKIVINRMDIVTVTVK